ncbi:MAG: ABC transporter ATP-binding protein [Gammaproteobacteria bacterium]
MARIVLEDLIKTFGGSVAAVAGISLAIEDGEFMVFVGPSGCGKTTTLNMICGLEEPTSGSITIGDRVVNDMEPGERGLGMVFQNLALFPHLSVFENIAFGLRVRKTSESELRERVCAVAETFRIAELLPKKPAQCSGGEAQRVALARTTIGHPDVLLLDEPLSSLDAKLRVEMRTELKRLHDQLGSTFVYVTHDQAEAMTMADRIVVMQGGRVQQTGTPLEIYRQPANRFVAEFFGTPAMNLIPGRITGQATPSGNGRFQSEHLQFELPAASLAATTGDVHLGVRAEHVGVGASFGEPAIPADVRLIEPLGDQTLVYFDYGGPAQLVAKVDAERDLKVGERTSFTFNPNGVLLFDATDGRRVGLPSNDRQGATK